MPSSGGVASFKEPGACTEQELRGFATLVRRGFGTVREPLDDRVRDSRCLAFHHSADDTLVAVAALKVPGEPHRNDIFRKAATPANPADYELDLGWVFVLPEHRRRGIAIHLCRQLVARAAPAGVFSTTRTNNAPMAGILLALGFERSGNPYARRDEELMLFLRSGPGEPME